MPDFAELDYFFQDGLMNGAAERRAKGQPQLDMASHCPDATANAIRRGDRSVAGVRLRV